MYTSYMYVSASVYVYTYVYVCVCVLTTAVPTKIAGFLFAYRLTVINFGNLRLAYS